MPRLDPTNRSREAIANDKAHGDLAIEQELAQTVLDRNMFRRMTPLLRPVGGHVATVIAIECVIVVTVFLRPWILREAIDHGLSHGARGWKTDPRLLGAMILALALTWAARFALSGVSQFIAGRAAIRVLNELRRQVFAHVQTLSIRYFDRTKLGRIVAPIATWIRSSRCSSRALPSCSRRSCAVPCPERCSTRSRPASSGGWLASCPCSPRRSGCFIGSRPETGAGWRSVAVDSRRTSSNRSTGSVCSNRPGEKT